MVSDWRMTGKLAQLKFVRKISDMGDCLPSRTGETTATGTIENGQTQTCRLINDVLGID